ncbi:hypothetical protein AVEN_85655-1 [Araneus ventricosus]|uniref:DUF4817 domain-containing protein n=1 Tax=Araneus ventricosus TaxID=182803 RepID=A0A4Y1ZKF2_ARAVE|nr:hypothetical protein AVEN_254482-1 [Araneus ventricosus]GBL55101.1 hypothetical protein AVEN_85655-1 [Araneus ventricosus]
MHDCVFLTKCFYESYSNEQHILPRSLTPQCLMKMMAKFEATGLLSVAPGRGWKPVSVETEEAVALEAEKATIERTHGTWSISVLACRMNLSLSTMYSR